MVLLKGTAVAKDITESVRKRTETFKRKPCLDIIMVGEDPGGLSYVTGAEKRMEKAGIECRKSMFPADITNDAFQAEFRKINEDPGVDGIIVMMPMPKQIDFQEMAREMKPEKDMDAITEGNRADMYLGAPGIRPCTPEAVIAILDYYHYPIEGKKATVIGRSLNIGRPVFHMLMDRNATVTVCHSKTSDLAASSRDADILVVAIGKAGKIGKNCVKPGAVVLDVGTNVTEEGKLVGDVRFDEVSEVAEALTPVPGGVGSVTTSILARHVADAYEKKEKAACKAF